MSSSTPTAVTSAIASVRSSLQARRQLLIVAGVLVASLALLYAGSCWDGHRVAVAEGEVHVYEQQVAAAEKARHAAAVATIAATAQLTAARQRADSLEQRAARAEHRAATLGAAVQIASPTTLAVQVTPSAAPMIVVVPAIVTEYIDSLKSTIVQKDLALAARDTQAVRADTVIVTITKETKADSTVITGKDSVITAVKATVPRFGFKWGFVAGVATTVSAVKLALMILRK